MARYLFVSTPVGPLGSGAGGGVEVNLINLARQLVTEGDQVHIIAPSGSMCNGIQCSTVPGLSPPYAQSQEYESAVMIPLPSVLATMWRQVEAMQMDFDLIVNWAYDWLPFYLTPFLKKPVGHIVSMGSLSQGLDWTLEQAVREFPGSVAVHSQAQARTFRFARLAMERGDQPFFVLPCGVDPSRYQFVPEANGSLCWVGRIAPEKGLEDCAAAAQALGMPITLLGRMQDMDYWQQVRRRYPEALLDYRGFFPTHEMQLILGRAQALLVTPKWVEAFGLVVVEALACGVPVITYRRGGPAEIVDHGKTGWVIPADNVEELVKAVERIPEIDRRACRQTAEERYSLAAMATQFRAWTDPLIQG